MVLPGERLVVAVAGLQVRGERRLECFRHFVCYVLLLMIRQVQVICDRIRICRLGGYQEIGSEMLNCGKETMMSSSCTGKNRWNAYFKKVSLALT
jgi:hypothetical protein